METRTANGGASVKGHEEEWQILCKQASVEQDPVKLLSLVERINQLLEAKNRRLKEKNEQLAAPQGGSSHSSSA